MTDRVQAVQPQSRFLRRQTLVLIGVGLALLIGGATAGYALGREEHNSKTMTVSGSITLWSSFRNPTSRVGEDYCYGIREHEDVNADTQVKVTDRNGRIIGFSTLGKGKADLDPDDKRPVSCTFPFKIEKLPVGRGIYGFEVAHHGVVLRSETDIQSKQVELQLR